MSELKAYLCIQAREIENKTFSCYNQTLAVKNAPEATMAQVYLKDEVDAAIAELERMDTEHTLQIAKMNGYIHHLEEERRWRKCSDEMPSNGQEVLVWLTAGGSHGFVLTSTYLDSQWYYGEDPQGCKPSHWMPLPSAPKEEK